MDIEVQVISFLKGFKSSYREKYYACELRKNILGDDNPRTASSKGNTHFQAWVFIPKLPSPEL